ncbi:unnamed protein product, partial [Prorocentrum cordatum]
ASVAPYQHPTDAMEDVAKDEEQQVRIKRLEESIGKIETMLVAAAGMVRGKCAPTDQQERVVIKASDFPSSFQKIENATHPGPKGNGGLFSLNVRRDMDVKSRKLSLAMGKVRQRLDALLRGRSLAGSSGLGGDARKLRSAEDPVRVAHLSALEGSSDVNHDLQQNFLYDYGIGVQAAALLEAANTAMRR